MKHPELHAQLQQLCARLKPFQFGIGGSCLLWQLGLENAPNDIDIVCAEVDFAAICAELTKTFSMALVAAHPNYASKHFARFSKAGWPDIELMAGIAVRQGQNLMQWSFQPERCHWQQEVCWMPAADWLQLYQLFDRPQRVTQLKRYLIALRLNTLSVNDE